MAQILQQVPQQLRNRPDLPHHRNSSGIAGIDYAKADDATKVSPQGDWRPRSRCGSHDCRWHYLPLTWGGATFCGD